MGVRISEAASYFGVHPNTLRKWDKQNIINCERETKTSHRYFEIKKKPEQKNIIIIPTITNWTIKNRKLIAEYHTMYPNYEMIFDNNYDSFPKITKLHNENLIHNIKIMSFPNTNISQYEKFLYSIVKLN